MERALHVTTCVSLQDYFQAHGEQGKGLELTGIWWLSRWRKEIEAWLRSDSYPGAGADCCGAN